MAQPAASLAAASAAEVADSETQSREVTQPVASPTASTRHEMASTSFQAINAPAATENMISAGTKAASPPKDTASMPDVPRLADSAHASKPDRSVPQAEDLDTTSTADAATYGTRSRNRTGNSRPNYAEDQDMEFEYTSTAPTAKQKAAAENSAATAASSTAAGAHAAGDGKRAQPESARFIAVNGAGQTNGSATKESTPGSHSIPTTLPKKRKAAGAQPVLTQTPPPSNSPAPTAARKVAAQSSMARETNVMTFFKSKSCLNKKGELVADDGTRLAVNGHVYLVCEPPGDPYYLCRIMEFLHVRSDDPTSPIDSLRVNWYYRPRDVQRFNSDSRLLYGTMHSDTCPIASLRGTCTIKHRSEIDDLDAYRKERDSFYFVQVFDRFIRRWYECIPVSQIVNVPEKVKKALDERWKFVVVETGRVKELTSDVKTCKRCAKYCASQDSVDCAICKNSYHMNCVQPPLPKKPSRGFAWACGPCSRASEKKMEARNTPNVSGDVTEVEEEEFVEEEQRSASNDTTRAPSPSGSDLPVDDHPATQAEIALAKMWPMRYLGIHCRVEDALQYDDRAIYPRASSRLGPRHQSNISMWPGRPVELVKPADIRKRYSKASSTKKDTKLTKETLAALEADREERARRPKWVQDEPLGYVARGEDYPADDPRNTAKLIFKMPDQEEQSSTTTERAVTKPAKTPDALLDDYVSSAKLLARSIGVPPFGTNFFDKALELLTVNNYDRSVALEQLKKVHRVHDLHEPVLSKQDLIRFEEGVAKYGSEHRLIRLHMKTNLPNSDIIRFYYLWKKTPKGREIWGNYGGRKGSKRWKDDAGQIVQQSVANDADDSAFDNDKAIRKNRGFQCKFCNTTHSRQWRKAPGVSPGQTAPQDNKGNKEAKEKGKPLLLALCLRCAGLWRKYAIQWEDVEEVAKKVAQGGGRAWKRRIDEELLRELQAANDAANAPSAMDSALPSIETNGEPQKKKYKTDMSAEMARKNYKPPPPPKEPTPPPPPIVPAQPQWRMLPCAVCKGSGDTISCAHCWLTVHRHCFGLGENVGIKRDGEVKWVCEQCENDRNPQVSTDYACCLCLTEETLIELVETPRSTHKKKTDREKEKERLEKELADAMRLEYRNKQLSLNRPQFPREPLKRTAGKNWVHVYCAVWMPEIRFSNAPQLEVAEGFQNIAPWRFDAICKLCKNKDHQNKIRTDKGACISCFQCHANVHVSCAFEAGYQFGFDVTPVKGSRKDQITTATLRDETGMLTAGVWCKEHMVKLAIHPINEVADDTGRTALQVFAENFKQADLTLTGTVRKANLAQLTKDKVQQALPAATNGARRESTTNSIAAAVRRGARTSSAADTKSETGEATAAQTSESGEAQPERRCVKCDIDVTPKWHPADQIPIKSEPTPPKSPENRVSAARSEGGDAAAQQSKQNGQNIRFMPVGASGRAWDGMPDRYAPRPVMNGEREMSGSVVNGEVRREADDGFHGHAAPPFRGHSSAVPLSEVEAGPMDIEPKQEYLCHRCFVKRKLDPTPPPEERPPRAFSSPRAQYPLPAGWNAQSQTPSQPPFDPSQPIRMPWDDPPPPPQAPQNQPHPPSVPPPGAGLGLSMGYVPPPPQPHHAPGYPSPYGQQPGGYHPPPPHAVPAPVHHERSSSYGYVPPPPPPPGGQPHYQPHGPPPQSPMQGFPPPPPPPSNSHIPNGVTSPRAPSFPPLPSPTRPLPPPQYQGVMGPGPGPRPGQSEPSYGGSSLPRIDHPPMDHRAGYVPPSAGHALHLGAQMSVGPPPQGHHGPPPPPPHPHPGHSRPGSQAGGFSAPAPTPPREPGPPLPPPPPQQQQPSQPAAGASASPNLKNLLS